MKYFDNYVGCCVNLDGPAISEMTLTAKDVSYDTFSRRIGKAAMNGLKETLGYVRDGKNLCAGLSLKTDRHVTFSRSSYEGKPCYFVTHSAIEYVFTD